MMHLGNNNSKYSYHMSGNDSTQIELSEATAEKDISVIVGNKLNFQVHVTTATKKANSILAIIKETFTCLDSVMIKKPVCKSCQTCA